MPLITFALLISLLAATDEAPPTDKPLESAARRAVPEVTTRPPRPIDVLHYDLTLRLNEDDAYIRGDVRMRLVPLADLDRITLDHEGRFYLAKDARLRPETLHTADPRAGEFASMRRQTGAAPAFASLQSERLGL